MRLQPARAWPRRHRARRRVPRSTSVLRWARRARSASAAPTRRAARKPALGSLARSPTATSIKHACARRVVVVDIHGSRRRVRLEAALSGRAHPATLRWRPRCRRNGTTRARRALPACGHAWWVRRHAWRSSGRPGAPQSAALGTNPRLVSLGRDSVFPTLGVGVTLVTPPG